MNIQYLQLWVGLVRCEPPEALSIVSSRQLRECDVATASNPCAAGFPLADHQRAAFVKIALGDVWTEGPNGEPDGRDNMWVHIHFRVVAEMPWGGVAELYWVAFARIDNAVPSSAEQWARVNPPAGPAGLSKRPAGTCVPLCICVFTYIRLLM